jgi:uncharacterized protein YggE
MKTLKICAFLLVVSGFALGEDRPQLKTVRVTGTAEVKVVPDRAVIEIGVEKESPSASQAKAAESAASRKILAALRAGGVDEKDIQTTYLVLRPSVRYEKKVRIPFFVAEQRLAVAVRDLSKLDQLLQSLVRAGGNRIGFHPIRNQRSQEVSRPGARPCRQSRAGKSSGVGCGPGPGDREGAIH